MQCNILALQMLQSPHDHMFLSKPIIINHMTSKFRIHLQCSTLEIEEIEVEGCCSRGSCFKYPRSLHPILVINFPLNKVCISFSGVWKTKVRTSYDDVIHIILLYKSNSINTKYLGPVGCGGHVYSEGYPCNPISWSTTCPHQSPSCGRHAWKV
jgi:hypothetical protein